MYFYLYLYLYLVLSALYLYLELSQFAQIAHAKFPLELSTVGGGVLRRNEEGSEKGCLSFN